MRLCVICPLPGKRGLCQEYAIVHDLKGLFVCIVLAICWVGTSHAAQPAADALRKQYQELNAKYNEVYAQYSAAREVLMKQDPLADVALRLAEVRDARDRKVAASANVATALKAYSDSAAAMNKTLESELAANPNGAELMKEIAGLDDQIEELDSQNRIANFMLSEIQRRVARKSPVRELYEALGKADNAQYDATRKDQKVQALYKAYEEATRLLLARPEVDKAKLAYEDALKNSPAIVEAQKARDAARAAYDQALAAAVDKHPDTPALKKKIDDLTQKVAALTQRKQAATAKLQEWRQKVSTGSPKVAEARKAYYAASNAYSQAVADAAPNESAAYQEVEKIYSEMVDARVNANPSVAALRKQVDDLQTQMQEMGMKVRRADGTGRRRRG